MIIKENGENPFDKNLNNVMEKENMVEKLKKNVEKEKKGVKVMKKGW